MPRQKSKPFSQAPASVLENFWKHFIVGSPDSCWEWLGANKNGGYGYLTVDLKTWAAPRISYYIGHGIDPGDNFVCHRCDNPPCVNWNHLFLGTQRDNSLDRHAKGRTVMPTIRALGENSPCHKLTCDKVREIRKLRTQGFTYPELGRMFGVTNQSVWALVNGLTWRHIK